MKIVIDIPEDRYKDIQRIALVQLENHHCKTAEQIIANGTPQPEKHTKERAETHACDCISRQAVIDNIKTRLYQTALNNPEYITSYADVCDDIAENRIDTWVNEVKSVEPERKTGRWTMDKAEQKEIVAQLKGVISDYSGPDEDGVVKGLLYAVYLIEHGKDYADQRIKLPRKGDGSWSCGCE